MIDLFEKCYKPGIADEAKARGIYPYFHALESKQDVTVIMEGKRRIMLGSNNYLGLTTNENVIRAGVEAYEAFGSGCSGSRFLNGTLKLHLELEKELAAFLRKDEVVTFSTGFQSNLGIISALVGLRDYVIMDRENHASLYDGCRLSYGTMLRYRHINLNISFHLHFLIIQRLPLQDFLVCSLAFSLYGRQNNIEISFAYNLLLNQDILKSNLHIAFDNFRHLTMLILIHQQHLQFFLC